MKKSDKGSMSILELAKKINRKGDHFIKSYGIKEFHKKASELLTPSDIHKNFDTDEIVKSVFSSKHPQNFKNLEFSDLPITISHGQHCFIDLYFWRRRPTVIHNHHFNGAFMCLMGRNVDFEYTFKKEKKLGRFHEMGVLKLKQRCNLIPGDIAEIGLMDKFIHQNHHQADLTVNLCFRTPQMSSKGLSNYLSSGLRFEKNVELLSRVARLLRLINLGLIDPNKTNLSTDESLQFLIQTFDTKSGNPRLLKLRKIIDKKIRDEFGVSIDHLLNDHDCKMEKLENEYE